MCLIILEITHIDYTKNQYDIDTYLNKYSDRNEDMPIDTYTSSMNCTIKFSVSKVVSTQEKRGIG